MSKALQEAVIRFSNHMKDRDYPDCFTKEKYEAWKVTEQEIPTVPIRYFTCRDCSIQYKKQMVDQNRCCLKEILVSKILD